MPLTFIINNSLLGVVGRCSAVVIRCVDFRVGESDIQFIRRLLAYRDKPPYFDDYAWPGSQRDVMCNGAFRERFLEHLRNVSIKEHDINCFIVLMHWDCAAFGGLKDEAVFQQELMDFQKFIKPCLPDNIEIYLCYSRPAKVPGMLEYVVMD